MKCIACEHENNVIENRFGGTIYHCNYCGLYHADDVSYKSAKESKTEDIILEGVHSLRLKNYKKIINSIFEYNSQFGGGNSLLGLDIGCAKGWFLDVARDAGIEMIGIESSYSFYTAAKEKGHSVNCGFFPQDFNSDILLDFIVFNDVFEHIPDLNRTLDSCRRYLKKDGLLIINCPTSEGAFFKIAKLMTKFHVYSYARRLWQFDFYSPHIWYFNSKNLDMLMTKYDFDFQASCSLETVDKHGLRKRVLCKNDIGVTDYLTYFALKMTLPIWQMLPSDIMCRFYRKR